MWKTKMNILGSILVLIAILELINATPTCPMQMMSGDVRIDDQEKLDQAINNLTGVQYKKLECVKLNILNMKNRSYKIDLVELLKIKSNFVIAGLGLKQISLECTGTSNDTDSPLSGLEYVGFHRIAFYNCKVPLWVENVVTVEMEEVMFHGSKEGAVNIFNCYNISIVNCSFENNNSTGLFARSRFQGSSAGLSIGMNRSTNTTNIDVSIVVDLCRFVNNNNNASNSDVHTATSLLTRNIITGRGGGMSLTLDSAYTVRSSIIQNHFEKNTASDYGGGLYFLIRKVTRNQTHLFKQNNFINNKALLTSGAMIYGLVEIVQEGSTINVNISRNYFEGNSAQLGGAFRFQRPTGNQGNYLIINNCTFKRNMAMENGAAIGISKAQFFNFSQSSIPITITNCTFSENLSLRGGTVFSAYTTVAFNGSNTFRNNQGVALNILASTVKFYGLVEFINNNVQKYDGGAFYMTALSQMILYDGATLNFINNTGSFGSAIVVEAFSRLTDTMFGTNNLCFMQYYDPSVSPNNWTNVNINFTGNQAIIGSAIYINSAQHCLSNSNTDDMLFNWPFMHYSINYNTGQFNGSDQKFYVQTPLTTFSIAENGVKAFPGETFPLTVKSFDLSNLPAAGILQLTLSSNVIGLDPTAIVLRPIHQSYGFTYDATNGIMHDTNYEVTVRAFRSSAQVEFPNVAGITVTMLPCPPGHVLHDKCQCDMNDIFIVDCFENFTAVILQLGLWGYSVNGRLGYYQCPHGYCQCTENGNALCSSVYHYNESNRQCNCDRQGILCGQCIDGAGVTALLNKCAHCSSTNAILIGVIFLTSIMISSILLLYRITLPEWLYPFLFYIQITGYVTDEYQTSFSYIQQTNLYISSALSLYFPYDFCLFSGMTPLLAYTLRYIPTLVSVLVFLVIFFMTKCCRSSKCPRMKVSYNGLWILIILVYSHTLYTSLSILHCPQVGDSNGNKKTVWFVDGTVECFTGGHAALATFAVIILIASIILMIFIFLVSLKVLLRRRWTIDLSNALTKPFKHECRWWSTVELFRRTLTILFIVSIPGNHAPTILLLIVNTLLYGYVQPFKVKLVNILEFAFLVDILLLQMIKSTNDIQAADFLNVIEYQRGCAKAIKVETFAFILMLLLLCIPMMVTLLLIVVSGGIKLKNGIAYLLNHKPVLVKRLKRDSLTWSYATTPTAAASSYLLVTEDGVHLAPKSAADCDTFT